MNLDDINNSPLLRAFETAMDIIDETWNQRLHPEPEPLIEDDLLEGDWMEDWFNKEQSIDSLLNQINYYLEVIKRLK